MRKRRSVSLILAAILAASACMTGCGSQETGTAADTAGAVKTEADGTETKGE